MEELRRSILIDSQIIERKSRFGLFNQPSPIGLGDDSAYKKKQVSRGEDGKPKTLPRNMLAGPNRSGVGKKDFVTSMSSICVGDTYLDPQHCDHLLRKKYMKKGQTIHETQFKTLNTYKSQQKYPYIHMDQNPLIKQKPRKDQTGRVITKDKNITSNSMLRVKKDLFKPLKYIPDPYERKQQQDLKEQHLSKQKRISDQCFRSMSHGNLLFSSDKAAYGEDQKAKSILKSKTPFVETAQSIVKQQDAFKPAKGCFGHPIGKYPEYMPDKNESDMYVRNKSTELSNDLQKWKPCNYGTFSRPTPSISCSVLNLRKYK